MSYKDEVRGQAMRETLSLWGALEAEMAAEGEQAVAQISEILNQIEWGHRRIQALAGLHLGQIRKAVRSAEIAEALAYAHDQSRKFIQVYGTVDMAAPWIVDGGLD